MGSESKKGEEEREDWAMRKKRNEGKRLMRGKMGL